MENPVKNNWLISLLLALLAYAIPSSAAAEHIPLSISIESSSEILALNLPNGVKSKVFSLQNPSRLVVDVSPSGAKPNLAIPGDYAGRLVKAVRSGQFNANTGRIVFELNAPATYKTSQNGRMLTITLSYSGDIPEPAAAEKPKKKPLIIIDPGHGGEDPGAIGPKGSREKHIVLQVAKELAKHLEASGKYRTELTRSGDYFIRLRERIEFARKKGGDVFISIHADSAPSGLAHGLSVYTLSENASDKEAEALATKENRSDIIAGMDLGEHDADVANILISLAQRETNNESARLADVMVGTLRDNQIELLKRTHRMAGFAVLKAPDIPSVLIETGFISHKEEEKKLNDAAYRTKLTRALAKGIDRYFQTVAEAK